jgi:hypothetical protein
MFLAGLASGCSAVTSSNEAAWNAAPPPAGDRLQEGKAHFERGNYGLAVAAYRASLRDDSSSVRALNGLAASYDRLGRFDLARRYYQQALEINPQSAQTLNNMGYSLALEARQKKGDTTLTAQARSYFQRASQSDGRHPSIVGNLAMLKAKPVSLTAPRELRKPLLAMAEPDRYGAWVERRNKERQLLVTSPSESFVASLRASGTKPNIVANSPVSPPPRSSVAKPRVGVLLVQAARTKGLAPIDQTAEARPVATVATLDRDMPLKRTPARATKTPWPLVAQTEKDATLGLETGRPDPHVVALEPPGSVTAQGPAVARLSEKSLSVVTSPPQDLLASLGVGEARPAATAGSQAKVRISEPQPLLRLQDPRASRRDEDSGLVANRAPRNLLADYAVVDVKPMVTATSQGTAQRWASRAEWLPIQLASTRPLSMVAASGDSGPPPADMPSVPVIEVRQAALGDLEATVSGAAAPMTILPEPKDLLAAPKTILAAPKNILVAAPIPLMAEPEARTPASTRSYALEVSNGTGRPGMAQRFVRYLEEQGVAAASVSDGKRFGAGITTLRYRSGFRDQAEALLRRLPIAVVLVQDDGMDGDMRLGLGNDLLYFDSKRAAFSRPN